ncbi:MAG TPA: hypothetical protein VN880_21340 [Solirubrobacteraceae bacterium]|nr:hypothetical protein [Solirubrobacteraceae bacterium]
MARGGEPVTVAGSFLVKDGDARKFGHDRVFSAWKVSRLVDQAP